LKIENYFMLLTIVAFVIVLSLLVFVHELGHFATARFFGIKSEEFGIGFPPRFLGYYKNLEGKWKLVRGNKKVEDAADTVYSLNYVPLGGFVRIKGEDGENTDPDSFLAKPKWQRSLVIVAGVTMNMLLAYVLVSVGLLFGVPQILEGIDSRAIVRDRQLEIIDTQKGSLADKAGLKPGDLLVGVDGTNIISFKDFQAYQEKHIGTEVNYVVKRAGAEVSFKLKPERLASTGKGGIGVAITESGVVRYPWYLAPSEGLRMTGNLTFGILSAFYGLLHDLVLGRGVTAEVAGPIKIAKIVGDAARMGLGYVVNLTIILSINLAIINILPLPALDGGRLLFIILEAIKGRPVKRETEAIIHNIGFMLLMFLMLIVIGREFWEFAGAGWWHFIATRF
jgi:regulator of sigma E protease